LETGCENDRLNPLGFLALSRRMGEEIIIDLGEGKQVIVRLFHAHNNRARIGVKASKDIGIYRRELWEDLQRQKGDTHEASNS
jgi:carbon storage regulator CsrA